MRRPVLRELEKGRPEEEKVEAKCCGNSVICLFFLLSCLLLSLVILRLEGKIEAYASCRCESMEGKEGCVLCSAALASGHTMLDISRAKPSWEYIATMI